MAVKYLCDIAPEAIPTAVANPATVAKRLGGNHKDASFNVPIYAKAHPKPITKRPKLAVVTVSATIKTLNPVTAIRHARHKTMRTPNLSYNIPAGSCMGV